MVANLSEIIIAYFAKTDVKKSLCAEDYLVFGFDFGFRSRMLTFFHNIASTARSYRGKYTYTCKVNI